MAILQPQAGGEVLGRYDAMRAGFRKGIVDDGSEGDIGMEEVKLYVQRFWADVLEQNADRLSALRP